MIDPFVSTPVIEEHATSPLGAAFANSHMEGTSEKHGVSITERFGLAICDVAAWPGEEDNVARWIGRSEQVIAHAPRRWTIISADQTLPEKLQETIGTSGTVCDLSHGRTVVRLSGSHVEWVLSKLFAIDFTRDAFPVDKGIATQHHEIMAQIHRVDTHVFDILVFRSYAHAFMKALTRAASDAGYKSDSEYKMQTG